MAKGGKGLLKTRGSRSAYLVSFLLKVLMIALFFAINGIISAAPRLSESVSFYESETVLVQTKNTGSCSYNKASLGVIDLGVGANDHPGDVVLQVTVNNVRYDDSYDKEVIGDNMAEYEDLFPSKDGPWDLCFSYAIESKAAGGIPDESKYYEVGFAGKSYSSSVVFNGSTNRLETNVVTVNKGDSLTLTINLGSLSRGSAIPAGEYRLHLALSRGVAAGQAAYEKLGLSRAIKLGFLTYRHALFHMRFSDVINFQSVLSFIVLLYSIGTAFYFYPDLRTAWRIFEKEAKQYDTSSHTITIVKKTFEDPYTGSRYTTTESYKNGGYDFILCLMKAILGFVVLVTLIPIRFFVFMVKDLVYAITGKRQFGVFYGLGCFIGSFGLWALLGSLVFFLAANWIAGAICAAVGIGGLIGARFLANDDHLIDEGD